MTDTPNAPDSTSRRRFLALGIGAAALLGGAAAGWHLWTRAPDFAGGALSVEEAHAKAGAGEILLIDIRRPEEWRATGIGAGAHPIDMRRDDFAEALTQIARQNGGDRPIALICARGVRSARLANRLADAGWERIIDVPEGMLGSAAGPGWLERDLPVRAPTGSEG